MNENTKTFTFVVAAALIAVVAVVSRPRAPQEVEEADARGKLLFEDFQPLAATSLEIFDFDESRATVRPFKVAQAAGKDGSPRWSIPSHDNYPADAQNQLADAATGMMGLTILDKVASSPGEHATYGVLDPDPNKLRAGATGVGAKVIMQDKDGKNLVAVIIGKEAPDGRDLRYVRRVGEDAVYIVQVKTDKLSTKFEEWIEKDLLKLSTWDIREFRALDYSFDEMSGQPNIRGQYALKYDEAGNPKWSMIEDRVIKDGEWADRTLGDDQELDATKLDAMRNAFDDLQIVDVSPKPEGLSADLRDTGTFRTNQEAVMSLATRGFYLVPVGNQHYELLSSEGEVRVVTKDGVQYTLRFGNVAAGTGGGRVVGEEANDESDAGGLNRYIFVMAEFDPEMIEKPELEPLPGAEPAATTEAESDASEDKPAAEETKPEETKSEETKSEGASEDAPMAGTEATEGAKGEGGDSDAKEVDPAERERIERDNKRKLDDYEKQVEDGKKKVQELNDRFANWYYVISDDVYKKIRLGRDEIVKAKEKPAEGGDGHDHAAEDNPLKSFNSLRDAGPAGNP
ncbi:MAG: DUF4340 domain-containing protein [Patescibacteria group bacterium]|nr:DUF4340 domain-containing protein [Patescibacteria group bacterium]